MVLTAFCLPQPTRLLSSRSPSAVRPVRCSALPTRVLVTAPLQYTARLTPHLLSLDLRPIIAPTITTTPLLDDRVNPLQEALLRLHEFQVLAFVSRTAIASVASQLLSLCENNSEAAALALQASQVRLAALGADALAAKQLLGRPADIIPLDSSPKGLVRFLEADQRLAGAAVLCPVPIVTGMPEPDVVPNFLRDLETAGFQLTSVPAYETRPADRSSLNLELGMLSDFDAVIFSSTGEAIALDSIMSDSEKQGLLERAREGKLVVAAHGPVTAGGVKRVFDIEPVVSDDYSSFEGVARAVANEVRKRRAGESLLVMT